MKLAARQLYEQTMKGYKYRGLLQEIGGQKLSPGCVLVPHAKKQKIEKFFRQFKLKNIHLVRVMSNVRI